MQSSLTQADVAKLLAEPSPHARADVARKLAMEIDNPNLTDSENALAQEVVRLMSKDVEATVRQALAENLRSATKLPHDIAVRLANDIETVAMPILEHSKVLTDADLVEIIRNGTAAKQVSVAARTDVSETVSEALVSSGGETAVAKLMQNANAKISESSLNKAVDRFKESAAVKDNIVKRTTLPVAVTERLIALVADNMRDYLVTHHQVSPAIAADLVLQSRERTVVGLSGKSSAEELEKLVTQMHDHQRLTPSLILRALCMGDVAFFEMSIAVLAKIPVVNARILIHDAGRLGIKALYERAGMPARLLPAVRVALDVVRETPIDGEAHDRERYRARVIERILTQYEDFSSEDLDYLLDKLGDVLKASA